VGWRGEWTKSKTRGLRFELTEQIELTEKVSKSQKKKVAGRRSIPIYKLSIMAIVWNNSIGQLGLAAWLCSLPALVHLLISQTWETEKKSLIF